MNEKQEISLAWGAIILVSAIAMVFNSIILGFVIYFGAFNFYLNAKMKDKVDKMHRYIDSGNL